MEYDIIKFNLLKQSPKTKQRLQELPNLVSKIPNFMDLLRSDQSPIDLIYDTLLNTYPDMEIILLNNIKKEIGKKELLNAFNRYHNLINQQLALKYKGFPLDKIMENQISFKKNRNW